METSRVLIDTSVLIRHFRTPPTAMSAFRKAARRYTLLFLSVMSLYEVEFGAARAGRISDLTNVSPYVEILPIDKTVAEHAARIHADLVALNQDIGVKDIFITATAMVNELPILTYNIRHFQRVPGLQVVSPSEL